MKIFGVVSRNGEHLDASKTLHGVKCYATRNGYKMVSERNGYNVVNTWERINKKWIKS